MLLDDERERSGAMAAGAAGGLARAGEIPFAPVLGKGVRRGAAAELGGARRFPSRNFTYSHAKCSAHRFVFELGRGRAVCLDGYVRIAAPARPDDMHRNRLIIVPIPERGSMSDMGTFRTTIMIENPLRRGDKRALPATLADTGAELTRAPRDVLESLGIAERTTLRFRTADDRPVYRGVGYAIVR